MNDDNLDNMAPAAADPPSPSSSTSSSSAQLTYDEHDRQMIRTIQLLIEKCLTFSMDREECIECLRRNAKLEPSVTRTVWDELEKSNPSFFAAYNSSKRRKEQPPMSSIHARQPNNGPSPSPQHSPHHQKHNADHKK